MYKSTDLNYIYSETNIGNILIEDSLDIDVNIIRENYKISNLTNNVELKYIELLEDDMEIISDG